MNTSYIQNQIKLISFMKCETNVSPLLIECWSLLLFIYAFLDTTMNYNKIGLNKNVRALWSLYLLIYNSEQLLSWWLFWAAIQLLFYHFSSSLSLPLVTSTVLFRIFQNSEVSNFLTLRSVSSSNLLSYLIFFFFLQVFVLQWVRLWWFSLLPRK